MNEKTVNNVKTVKKEKLVVAVSVRLPADTSAQVKDLAAREDRSFNWMVNNLLVKGLKEFTRKR